MALKLYEWCEYSNYAYGKYGLQDYNFGRGDTEYGYRTANYGQGRVVMVQNGVAVVKP